MPSDDDLQPLKLPALRAHMGDWIYYICLMKMRDIASRISFAEEIHISESLNELLQRIVTDRSKDIATYLLSQQQRLFNALVVGVYGGRPDWYELTVQTEGSDLDQLPGYMEGVLGILRLDGAERIWAIDGQHRVAGIRQAIQENPEIGEEEVCVIFVAGVTSQHADEDPTGYERTRRLFTTLNRYAKPVSKTDIIALDEDDVVAIVTRRLVEEYGLFYDKISIRQTRSIPVTDTKSLTSIVVLYDVMNICLRDRGAKAWKRFKTIRPSDDEIEGFYNRAVEFWQLLTEHFPPLQELRESVPAEAVAGRHRHNRGGHLLFRPVGLLAVARVLRYLVDNGTQLAEAVRLVSQAPMEISAPPWAGLLWDIVNKRMLTAPENQKAARWLLFYSVGGDLHRLKTNLDRLRQEYAGILNRDPNEIGKYLATLRI
ncbi:MAG: DGQHR domain-containing protein [Anaerolineales bacterium]|nr:MAG: DGQHR domain-containing protein [Anaerolineales bacterium]